MRETATAARVNCGCSAQRLRPNASQCGCGGSRTRTCPFRETAATRDFPSQLEEGQGVGTELVVLVRPQDSSGILPSLGGMLEEAGQVSRRRCPSVRRIGGKRIRLWLPRSWPITRTPELIGERV